MRLWVIAIAAGAMLALEILAIRLLIPVIGSEGRTVSLAIAAIVAGAALGTEAGRRIDPRWLRLAPGLALSLAAPLIVLAPLFLQKLSGLSSGDLIGSTCLTLLIVSPASALLALPYPIIATDLAKDRPSLGRAAAHASAVSNLGAMLGGLTASLPIAGLLPTSIGLIVIALCVLLGAFIAWRVR